MIENLFLSIGAMKAATSWLYMLLRGHPQIDAVPVKEIHYFAHHHTGHTLLKFPDRLDRLREMARWLPADKPHEARALLAWYRAYLTDPVDDAWLAGLYRDPQGPAWCADFSNLNALLPSAGWRHVRQSARHVRILYTMRHPMERLWSHTRFHLAFTGEIARLAEWTEADYRRFLTLPEIAAHSRYARVIGQLEQWFDRDEYCLIYHEEIESTPLRVLSQIEEFLGIAAGSYDAASLSVRHNPGPPKPMPQAFISAAARMVELELAALEDLGLEMRACWRTPYLQTDLTLAEAEPRRFGSTA